MKVDISAVQDWDKGYKVVGQIMTVGGKAQATTGAKNFLLPEIIEPETMAPLTPKDGDRYVQALPETYAHSTRVSADLVS